MSVKTSPFTVLNAIRDMGTLNHIQATLLEMIYRRKHKDHDYSWPSYQLLARDTRLSISALKRASRELVDLGYLTKKARRNRSNLWTVNTAKVLEFAERAKQMRRMERLSHESSA